MTQDSICCGATINYQDFCSECGEHTGAIQFEDAAGEPVTQYVTADGFLQDAPDSRQCDCGHRDWQHLRHNICDTCECYGFTNEAIRRNEYEPNFKGFISTVTGKEIATVGLVVLMFVTIWIAV